MHRYLLLVSRIHSVAITSENISDGQSGNGHFIKAGRHCMQGFFCLPEACIIIFHCNYNDLYVI